MRCVAVVLLLLGSSLAVWADDKKKTEPEDGVVKGTLWKGIRTFTEGDVAGRSVEFELKVTSRDGKNFAGYTTLTAKNGNVHAHDIKGTIEDGAIEWKVVKQRAGTNPSQPHRGSSGTANSC